jgi:hypothetical protein
LRLVQILSIPSEEKLVPLLRWGFGKTLYTASLINVWIKIYSDACRVQKLFRHQLSSDEVMVKLTNKKNKMGHIDIIRVMTEAVKEKLKDEKYKVRVGRGPILDTEMHSTDIWSLSKENSTISQYMQRHRRISSTESNQKTKNTLIRGRKRHY